MKASFLLVDMATRAWENKDKVALQIMGDKLEEEGDCRAIIVHKHINCCMLGFGIANNILWFTNICTPEQWAKGYLTWGLPENPADCKCCNKKDKTAVVLP